MNNCRNVINDESGCTVFVKRLFDAVSIPLDGAVCTVTLHDSPVPASTVSGSTSYQVATVVDLVHREQCRYRKATGKLLASGTAILTLCSYTPMVIPGAFTVCPDSTPREAAPKSVLPLFPRCELP